MAKNDVEVAVPRWAATPVLVATTRLASTMTGPNTGVLPVTGSSYPPTSSGWFAERSIITNANSSSEAKVAFPTRITAGFDAPFGASPCGARAPLLVGSAGASAG